MHRRTDQLASAVALVVLAIVPPSNAEPLPPSSLSVDGTEFVIVAPNGEVRRGRDLVGATITLRLGEQLTKVTIASAETAITPAGDVLLYRFMTADGKELCAPDENGRSYGFPVPDAKKGFVLTCTSGAIGKCVRWGYRPWEEKPDGPPLRALHNACVRMVRADYGGDGTTHTADGTLVYVCDRFGVRKCDKDPPLTFEAGWGEAGATCVARSRIATKISLEQIRNRYPKLKYRLGAQACTLRSTLQDSETLLINRSAGARELRR